MSRRSAWPTLVTALMFVTPAITLGATNQVAAQTREPPNSREAGKDTAGVIRPISQFDAFLQGEHTNHADAARAKLREMLAVVLKSPALSPPVGFDLKPTLIARTPLPRKDPRVPIQYELTGHIFWYAWQPGIGRVAPTPVGMAAIYLTGNDPAVPLNRLDRWADDTKGSMFWEPEEVERINGHPVYRTGRGNKVVMIARSDRPLWLPATREQILERLIGTERRIAGDLPAARRGEAQARITCLGRELAGLTPTEREEPAHLSVGAPASAERCSPFVPPDALGARRIVYVNPDYFDPSLPPTALQVLALSHSGNERGRGWRMDALTRVRDAMDLAALTSLLADR